MRDNTDNQDSAGYSDLLTDFGFFIAVGAACAALGVFIWWVL